MANSGFKELAWVCALNTRVGLGYVGIGEKEDVQLFYYFVESTRNPLEDPLIFYIPGGPGASALITFLYETGPLFFNLDDGLDNLTLKLNPNAWTQMASVIFVDMPAGTGFSYAETKEGWTSSDSNMAIQANQFIKKFLTDHPKFLKNSLYLAGISYIGVVLPRITLEIYEGNERGDQPSLNIQGYILMSPLTHKFNDFNSRLEYAHRLALISDDIYKSAIEHCNGNYVNVDSVNSVCAASLQRYDECTSRINMDNVLEEFCDENDPMRDCDECSKVLVQMPNPLDDSPVLPKYSAVASIVMNASNHLRPFLMMDPLATLEALEPDEGSGTMFRPWLSQKATNQFWAGKTRPRWMGTPTLTIVLRSLGHEVALAMLNQLFPFLIGGEPSSFLFGSVFLVLENSRHISQDQNDYPCPMGWPGSSSANENSIPKPSEYLLDRRLYLYGELSYDRSRPVSISFPRRLPTRGKFGNRGQLGGFYLEGGAKEALGLDKEDDKGRRRKQGNERPLSVGCSLPTPQ
ncbi:peptidase S10, serine carboxypeptidase, Alpha/Beta hydrolase fold protein [Artemisia annua]|uniref:Peptidase S10, serine carboxypeptidase, Alpha/Beta hydrolase fold protein n=1 Tax=Artemisia annua TaxID=35608 RepID=A0A2U1L580_ARTAN|nr:peptidase S10, serine carboxypeptidase, Alpha/Beta hydrolase fold protein [Artemisia annua]